MKTIFTKPIAMAFFILICSMLLRGTAGIIFGSLICGYMYAVKSGEPISKEVRKRVTLWFGLLFFAVFALYTQQTMAWGKDAMLILSSGIVFSLLNVLVVYFVLNTGSNFNKKKQQPGK